MRIAIGVEYDGRSFKGWQLQRHEDRTVQAVVERALSRVANHAVRVVCAGRTDAGVHALGQVIHFDTGAVRSPRNWMLGGNVHLPDEVAFTWVQPVADDFHARFDARSRRYRYVILNRPSRSALFSGRVTWIHRELDAELMHAAVQALVGTHDFTSYRAIGCQAKQPVRTLHEASVVRAGDWIEITVHANAFLHHMVRNIAGVLLAIGRQDRPVDWAREVLEQVDRTQGGVTAPPDGLYFERVWYPPAAGIPAPPLSPFAGGQRPN